MGKILKKVFYRIFLFSLIFFTTKFIFKIETVYASEFDSSSFIKKVSKSYTKKFCNSIAFGLSKESAMNFSIAENNQVFEKRKEMKNINKELLAEEISISVVEECGYPISLSGQKGINEFKNYYLEKDSKSK